LLPGELFVHRNIANLVVHTDLNCLSVMQFAVDILKVRHIIVCGHYGCSGVQAALRRDRLGLSDNWLRHVQDVREKHHKRLVGAASDAEASNRLCELNVIEQVANVCQTTIARDAWERGQELAVHGWIYGLENGLLRDLSMSVAASMRRRQFTMRPWPRCPANPDPSQTKAARPKRPRHSHRTVTARGAGLTVTSCPRRHRP
jgi:carbonic anhydrase